MNNFKVTEVVNATTIKVEPKWSLPRPDGTKLVDDKIKIAGLNVDDDNARVIRRLTTLLIGCEIEAYDPSITVGQTASIECRVFLSRTDILYYFPEYHPA